MKKLSLFALILISVKSYSFGGGGAHASAHASPHFSAPHVSVVEPHPTVRPVEPMRPIIPVIVHSHDKEKKKK